MVFETMNAVWCMIWLCKNCGQFFEGLCQSELQTLLRNMVLFETCENIAIGSLFLRKNETKEKVLNKSESLVKIFEVVFLGVLSYKVRSSVMFGKTFLNPSIFDGKSCLWMNACMHDYAEEYREHGVVKSIMLELRVNTPFGKDYGFNCTCNKGSTKIPNSNPLLNISVYRNAPSPI